MRVAACKRVCEYASFSERVALQQPPAGARVTTLTGATVVAGPAGAQPGATAALDLSASSASSSSRPLLALGANATLLLRDLALDGAALVLPSPLSAPLPLAQLLGLRAVVLQNVLITTPSCVQLSVHQAAACRALAPSPHLTGSSPSLTAVNVTLTCAGPPVPHPCVAVAVGSGQELVDVLYGAYGLPAAVASSGPVPPTYIMVTHDITLAAAIVPVAGCAAQGPAPPPPTTISVGGPVFPPTQPGPCAAPVTSFACLSPPIAVTSLLLISGGTVTPPLRTAGDAAASSNDSAPAAQAPVLDLGGANDLLDLTSSGCIPPACRVELHNLSLSGLPLGPPITYAVGLLRGLLWWVGAACAQPAAGVAPDCAIHQEQHDHPWGGDGRGWASAAEVTSLKSAKVLELARLQPDEVISNDRSSTLTGGDAQQPLRLVLAQDALLVVSMVAGLDVTWQGDFGHVQVNISQPGLILGDPAGPRLLNLSGRPALINLRGPLAALTLRDLVFVVMPPAGLHPAALRALGAGIGTGGLPGTADVAVVAGPLDGSAPPGKLAAPSGPTLSSATWWRYLTQGSPRPAALPRATLDGVVLLVPYRELRLLAWCAAHNSTAPLTDPGVVEEVAAMLAGSQLVAPGLVRRQLAAAEAAGYGWGEGEGGAAGGLPPPSSPSPLRSITFWRFSWCGLYGRNVTLASWLPYASAAPFMAATPFPLELPDRWGPPAAVAPSPPLPGPAVPGIGVTPGADLAAAEGWNDGRYNSSSGSGASALTPAAAVGVAVAGLAVLLAAVTAAAWLFHVQPRMRSVPETGGKEMTGCCCPLPPPPLVASAPGEGSSSEMGYSSLEDRPRRTKTTGTLASAVLARQMQSALAQMHVGISLMQPLATTMGLAAQRASVAADEALVLTGELGRGAQGVVYSGRWRGLEVAVKCILLTCGQDGSPPRGGNGSHDGPSPAAAPAAAAASEAAITASMAHPNLVACYTFELVPLRVQPQEGGAEGIMRAGSNVGVAVGDDGSTPDAWRLTLVLERCNGGSLRSFLAAGWRSALAAIASSQAASGTPSTASATAAPRAVEVLAGAGVEVAPRRPAPPQLPPATIARLALDVARGLAYLHSRGVAHGDLSSANVLLHLLSSPRRCNDTAESIWPPLQAGPITQSPSPAQLLTRLTAKVCDFGLSQ
ncbi:hypothetical protein TSOC_007305 [Tetrabaena socialis]|uniref:Protein kinase domain-containing protein n=1 Tax=Tetrabaena socialis TaxID=47790 RepID=A0A2J8A1C7_9CHLO|nr:hypothetical protein TSOC_007305 [Tetrabaena socialis]|eukprot:PNH06327.1 hypothetical protein TSOC_007305 [Tetrabaena socialis]